MNDIERQVRDTLRRHEDEAPLFDASDARRASRRTRRRQILNVAALSIGSIALMIGVGVGVDGLLRADPGPTVLHQPPSVVTPTPSDAAVAGWPTASSHNPAGVYSWDKSRCGSYQPGSGYCGMGLMHNGQSRGSGNVDMLFLGVPGRLIPHRGQTAVSVAGFEGTYRQFIGGRQSPGPSWMNGLPTEEWMVDIQGTTVTILLIAEHGARETELADAHAIIGSIRAEPQDNDLGFRLDFTLTTNDWDSG
jgi:hypothetical protein